MAREARKWFLLTVCAILIGTVLGAAYNHTLRERLQERGVEPLAASGLDEPLPPHEEAEPIDVTPPSAPDLRAPADGELVPTTRPTFTWAPAVDESPVMYRLQFSQDPSFPPSATTQIGNVFTTSWQTPEGSMFVPLVKTFWRVQAMDVAGNDGPWSEARAFTTTPRL